MPIYAKTEGAQRARGAALTAALTSIGVEYSVTMTRSEFSALQGVFSRPNDMHQPMHYNFNIYRGRKVFNLHFSARNHKRAIADATDLVPNFAGLRWTLWYGPPNGPKWRKGHREYPQIVCLHRQTRTTSHQVIFEKMARGIRGRHR
jgi:hypothetical protein